MSSLYEIAQDTLQVHSKDCLKVQILIFFSNFQTIYFFCNWNIISFQMKKKIFEQDALQVWFEV